MNRRADHHCIQVQTVSRISTLLCGLFLVTVLKVTPSIAQGLEFSDEDTVIVTAARAWEADEVDVVHFSGQFVLRGPDWSLSGDTAVVFGKLDDPDKIVVEGNPAQVSFLRTDNDDASAEPDTEERVDGSAAVVEYFRASDRLTMRGDASLTRKDSTLSSESIEYDVETDRYSAGGQSGINILLNLEDD